MCLLYYSYFARCSRSTCFILVQFIKYVICIMCLHVCVSKCKLYTYIYVNKRCLRNSAIENVCIIIILPLRRQLGIKQVEPHRWLYGVQLLQRVRCCI